MTENELNQMGLLAARLAPAAVLLLLSACSAPKLWPFGAQDGRAPVPENAAQYRCNAAKSFYLRMLADGDAWVILSEREFRLAKVAADGGRRFSNGAATLDLGQGAEAEASLNDGPAIAFTGCKAATRE